MKFTLSTLVALLRAGFDPIKGVHKVYKPRPMKPCLQCGKMHDHNNAWCSGEHCHQWRAEQRNKS